MPARAAAALEVRSLSRLFKALGDDTRVRIVALLAHGELCVCHVQEALIQRSSKSSTSSYRAGFR
jgi:ArsR family transcriptional regulator, arsenate/arsenite/antimonite-responsive transcriptional repressor